MTCPVCGPDCVMLKKWQAAQAHVASLSHLNFTPSLVIGWAKRAAITARREYGAHMYDAHKENPVATADTE